MNTLFLFVVTSVFAIGPDVDGHPTRNLAVPPTVTQSVVQAGTFPDWSSCDRVAEVVHDRKTAYADIETQARCLDITADPSSHAAALDR